MQVYKPFKIQLIFKATNTFFYLDKFTIFVDSKDRPYFGEYTIQDVIFDYGKPIGFKLIELNVPVDNLKLIHWLQHNFKDMFAYDPLIWFASVGTIPIKLRQYLIPFYQESKEPKCHILGPSSN